MIPKSYNKEARSSYHERGAACALFRPRGQLPPKKDDGSSYVVGQGLSFFLFVYPYAYHYVKKKKRKIVCLLDFSSGQGKLRPYISVHLSICYYTFKTSISDDDNVFEHFNLIRYILYYK